MVNTLGRRKTSVARLYIKPGKGEIVVNGRKFEEYFPVDTLQIVVKQPLTLLDNVEKYDLDVRVAGGGPAGQAQAIRLAISRALCEFNIESRPAIKKEGYLTRDSRMVERKKYGRKKARARFQWTKR